MKMKVKFIMNKLNVLITGAASGIGAATVNAFLEEGHTVFALDVKGVEEKENLTSYVADITSRESLQSVKSHISSIGVKLDVIICVAGVHTMASLAESDFSEIKRIIDVNLVGTMQTVNVFHSLLCDSGRVVILTSEVATYSPMPFNGIYNVSKTALECYADALRQELNLIGQKVVTVRPGAVKTPLADRKSVV